MSSKKIFVAFMQHALESVLSLSQRVQPLPATLRPKNYSSHLHVLFSFAFENWHGPCLCALSTKTRLRKSYPQVIAARDIAYSALTPHKGFNETANKSPQTLGLGLG